MVCVVLVVYMMRLTRLRLLRGLELWIWEHLIGKEVCMEKTIYLYIT